MENEHAAYKTILSSKAQSEIQSAWDWYEERQQGLGGRFVTEVISRLFEIENHPERYPTKHKSFKETRIKTFPFLIIYRINKKKKLIYIISVFHTSLNPKKKYR